MALKYEKRVFAMDERELRAVLAVLVPGREGTAADSREAMQELLVDWLLSRGMSARHEFALFREQGSADAEAEAEVWLLSKGPPTKGQCKCCGEQRQQGHRPPPAEGPAAVPHPRQPPPPAAPTSSARPPRGRRVHNVEPGVDRKVITEQPVHGVKWRERVERASEEAKKGQKPSNKSPPEECCVECGRFCVDLVSAWK